LKVVKAAGLVKGEVEGPHTCCCLDREVLEDFEKPPGRSDPLKFRPNLRSKR
jgi:hypothetical protein